MTVSPEQFTTYSLGTMPKGDAICRILAASVNGADPSAAIKRNFVRYGNHLSAGDASFNLDEKRRIFVISFGKASLPMAAAVNEILGDTITSGLVITKSLDYLQTWFPHGTRLKIFQASHPLPDLRNLDAAEQLSRMITRLHKDDLVIVLISGGGSSLLTQPSPGISLFDLQQTTQLLLNSGASIEELNTVRKHLDIFKGGGLARLLSPACVLTFILSDVVGDRLDVIASGPTVPDASTFSDAWAVLSKYQLENYIPVSISTLIAEGIEGKLPDTLKPGNPIFNRITNIIIGNNTLASDHAGNEAMKSGFNVIHLAHALQGEASQTGKDLFDRVKTQLLCDSPPEKPACFIAGGETTVTIKGDGYGGRNQELVLGSVEILSGSEPYVMVSLATDGDDGPTDAAGAVATHLSYNRGMASGMYPQEYLVRNDSYNYFKPLGDLIKTGPTFTNVNDLFLLFAL